MGEGVGSVLHRGDRFVPRLGDGAYKWVDAVDEHLCKAGERVLSGVFRNAFF